MEDKFVALGLQTLPAKHVQAPLVAGCHANVECRLANTMKLDGLFLFVGQAGILHRRPSPTRGPPGGKNLSAR
jgi:flavin reductase (DIM6/NTAB) family NADH-FMN oxidoreductase RutF